jgi:predicted component of type VI protein secretion system
MIQLNVLSGRRAGCQMVVRRFPFRVGRAAGNDLELDDDGVWNEHIELAFQRNAGFTVSPASDALMAVNGQPMQSVRLNNGDVISFGSVKMQFWLAAVAQRGLRLRELFVWALLLVITLSQVALVYWLVGMD